MERALKPKFLLLLAVMVAMVVQYTIKDLLGISISRATAVLCVLLAVIVFGAYCITKNSWLRRFSIALFPAALILWVINSDFAILDH